jgi:hypothetical protein
MTPKEQAQEIIAKYENIQWDDNISVGDFGREDFLNSIPTQQAIQCALIAVQYIINSNPHSNPLNTNIHSTMEYWHEVKQAMKDMTP